EPAADRRSVDRADDRFLRAEQPYRLDIKMPDRRHRFAGPLALLVERRAVAEIRAGAERLPLRGEHHGAAGVVSVERIERIRDRVDQYIVEVVVRRTLDLDGGDEAGLLDADIRKLSHRGHPFRNVSRAL